jgi:hypothetical protein
LCTSFVRRSNLHAASPGTLLSAFIGAGICWLLIRQSQSYKAYEALLSRLLLPAMLGISVFFAVALWLEHSRWADRRHSVGLAVGLTILLALCLSYSSDSPQIDIYRFFQLALASHLLVAVAPFHRGGSVAAFWEFNRILFQRILQSVLFSTILYAGLAIALWAVQSLLGVKVDWRAYYFLFLSVAFLFNTWFFVAGVPSDWQELESEYEYPAGLRMFVQFILLPSSRCMWLFSTDTCVAGPRHKASIRFVQGDDCVEIASVEVLLEQSRPILRLLRRHRGFFWLWVRASGHRETPEP